MSDDDKEAAKRRIEELTQSARESAGRLVIALKEEVKGMAADVGEPLTEDNAGFFDSLAALAMAGEMNSSSPELHQVVEIAKTVIPRNRNQWSAALRQRDRMYEEEGHTGETLAFDQLLRHKPEKNTAHRADVLRQCAEFYRVPEIYQPVIGDVVTKIMEGPHKGWLDMPIGWVHVYALVVWTIVARCKPDENSFEDRQHRSRNSRQ